MRTPNVGSPWAWPPLNSDADRVRAASSLAAGILAGFSVTTIVTLITTDKHPWLLEPTLLLFSIAASAALLALSYQAWAQGYWSRPDDYMAWRPRARVNIAALQEARKVQYNDMSVYKALYIKADRLFRISAVAFFVGLLLLLCPDLKAGHFSAVRLVSLGIVALGLLAFLLTSALPGWRFLGSRLLAPELYQEPQDAPALTGDDIESLALDRDTAIRMKKDAGIPQKAKGMPSSTDSQTTLSAVYGTEVVSSRKENHQSISPIARKDPRPTDVRHCRHCWGDCRGECLLEQPGMCIHGRNTKITLKVRFQWPLSLKWQRTAL
jgi:hypothetical protein